MRCPEEEPYGAQAGKHVPSTESKARQLHRLTSTLGEQRQLLCVLAMFFSLHALNAVPVVAVWGLGGTHCGLGGFRGGCRSGPWSITTTVDAHHTDAAAGGGAPPAVAVFQTGQWAAEKRNQLVLVET